MAIALAVPVAGLGADASLSKPAPATRLAEAETGRARVQTQVESAVLAELNELGVRPAGFQQVLPGITTVQEARRLLGEPQQQTETDGESLWTYKIGPFPKVEILSRDELVQSIIIQLSEPIPAADAASELDLRTRPAPVRTASGEVLGQVYPERGVVFRFAERDASLVCEVMLEPIAAELFILRASDERGYRYEQQLTDLELARRIDPSDARIDALETRVLLETDHAGEALRTADQAVQLQPDELQYQLLQAEARIANGQWLQAEQQLQQLLTRTDLPAHWKARGEYLLGNTIAYRPAPDYPEAARQHMLSIQTAAPLVRDPDLGVRRVIRETLIDAHLAIAHNIARGNWTTKKNVVPRWLRNAELLAKRMADEEKDSGVLLHVYCGALRTYAALQGPEDPSVYLYQAIREGRMQLAAAEDPLHKRQVAQRLADILLSGVQIEQGRSRHVAAMTLAQQALELLDTDDPQRVPTPQENYLAGQLYFRLGSLYAVAQRDHVQAITWYEKSLACLNRPLPAVARVRADEQGDQLISMGLSYWQSGAQSKGLELTQRGVERIEAAVKQGLAQNSALSIPYGNLADMQRQLGNPDEAQRYAGMAAALQNLRR